MKSAFDNWSDIRVFLAVVRHGSTLAASKTLGMSQPTVARRIDALEHALKLTLFERETRGFCPTSAARDLIPLAEKIEAAAHALSETAVDLSRPKGIRVTGFARNFSPDTMAIFAEFNDLHPDIPLRFLQSVQVLDLIGGEADVALRVTFSKTDPNLIQRKISRAQFTLFGSKSYAEKHGLPRSPDELKGHKFVTFQRDDIPWTFHTWLMRYVTPDQIIASYAETDLLDAAVLSGRALGMMNVRLSRKLENVEQCFDAPEELCADHAILIPPDAWRRPEVKTFVKFFAPRYAALFKD